MFHPCIFGKSKKKREGKTHATPNNQGTSPSRDVAKDHLGSTRCQERDPKGGAEGKVNTPQTTGRMTWIQIPWLGYGGYGRIPWLGWIRWWIVSFFPFLAEFWCGGFPLSKWPLELLWHTKWGVSLTTEPSHGKNPPRVTPAAFVIRSYYLGVLPKTRALQWIPWRLLQKPPTRIDAYCIFPTVNQAGIK